MAQLLEFSANHWPLCVALVAILILLFIHEARANGSQGSTILPQMAVNLMNHQNAKVIDIREKEAFREGHIINSVNNKADSISNNNNLKKSPFIVVCNNGQQSSALINKLRQAGFEKPFALKGGLSAWKEADLPLTSK